MPLVLRRRGNAASAPSRVRRAEVLYTLFLLAVLSGLGGCLRGTPGGSSGGRESDVGGKLSVRVATPRVTKREEPIGGAPVPSALARRWQSTPREARSERLLWEPLSDEEEREFSELIKAAVARRTSEEEARKYRELEHERWASVFRAAGVVEQRLAKPEQEEIEALAAEHTLEGLLRLLTLVRDSDEYAVWREASLAVTDSWGREITLEWQSRLGWVDPDSPGASLDLVTAATEWLGRQADDGTARIELRRLWSSLADPCHADSELPFLARLAAKSLCAIAMHDGAIGKERVLAVYPAVVDVGLAARVDEGLRSALGHWLECALESLKTER